MKKTFALILLYLSLSSFSFAQDRTRNVWVYFDLGNTLVDTKTHNFEKIFYMPGALAYLKELRHRGHPLGLIANVPESWGSTYQEKLHALKKLIADHWTDNEPMAWDIFNAGILLPPDDKHRKPDPLLFLKAAHLAHKHGAIALYEGDDAVEVEAAKKLGMPAYLVGSESDFFLSPDKIEKLRHKTD